MTLSMHATNNDANNTDVRTDNTCDTFTLEFNILRPFKLILLTLIILLLLLMLILILIFRDDDDDGDDDDDDDDDDD